MARTNKSVLNQKFSPKVYKSSVTDWALYKSSETNEIRNVLYNKRLGGYLRRTTEVCWVLYAIDSVRVFKTITIAKRQANNLYFLPTLFAVLLNKDEKVLSFDCPNTYKVDANADFN
jgi:hypothetical protein